MSSWDSGLCFVLIWTSTVYVTGFGIFLFNQQSFVLYDHFLQEKQTV